MTTAQILGLFALGIGGVMYAKKRGCGCSPSGCGCSEPSGPSAAIDLWPEAPSDLGTIFDSFVLNLVGDKQGGNTPAVAATPSTVPIQSIPNLAPSLDEYLPPPPINPDLGAGSDVNYFEQGGDPNLAPWMPAAYGQIAWLQPLGASIAPGPSGVDEYFTPGV